MKKKFSKLTSLMLLIGISITLAACDLFITSTVTTTDTTITTPSSVSTSTSTISEENNYLISFDSKGGTDISPSSVNIGSSINLPTPIKEGFTFLGWSVIDYEVSNLLIGLYQPTDDMTLFAIWQINQYTISFEEAGGTEIADITQDFGTTVTAPTNPTKVGHTFGGWYTESALTNAYSFTTIPTTNIILYAKWIANQYTISFDSKSGSTVLPITQDYGTAIVEPNEPIKEGFTFDGWYLDEGFNQLYTFTTMPSQSVLLYAKWVSNSLQINFNSNGGSLISPIMQQYGTAVIEPNEPIKEGYTFDGWFLDEEFIQAYAFTTMPAQSVFLYAKWIINSYTIEFVDSDDSQLSIYTFAFNSDLTNLIIASPEAKPGFEFINWDTPIPDIMPANNLVIKATYSFYLEYQLISDQIQITGTTNLNITKIVIPEIIDGMPVTDIAPYSLFGLAYLKEVVIPKSILSIGDSAFYGASSLTNITIPNSVTSIGALAFSGASSLTSILVESNNNYYSSENGILFNKNKTILVAYPAGNLSTEYVIPNSVTSIGAGAFYGASSLTSILVEINNNYYSSENGILFNKDKTILIAYPAGNIGTEYVIPNSVTSIGTYAFSGAGSLTSITIPNSVISIGSGPFSGASSLTSITIPFVGNTRTSTGFKTYFGYIFGTNNYIGSYSANGYYLPISLKEVIITDATSIGAVAFKGASSLTSITIPNSVTSIGRGAFYGTSSLTSILVESNNNYYSSENGILFNKDKTILIAYPAGNIGTEYVIPNSVTSISEDAFYGTSSLISITIPNSVTSIGAFAFHGAGSLTSITIPNSVTSIGALAFSGAGSLTSITIPNSVTSIGTYAFSGASSLTSITIPFVGNTRTSTGSNAYFGYIFGTSSYIGSYSANGYYLPMSLKEVIITYATKIESNAFYGASSLTSITLPNSVTSIGSYAFYGANSLTSITIPNNVTSIGALAFSGASSLTSITIPNSVTSIGDSAFLGASSLESITLPFVGNTRTSTGSSAYFGYIFGKLNYLDSYSAYEYYLPISLKEVIITDATSIGDSAFRGANSLTNITIPNSVTSIGAFAFHRASSLTSITIPNSVTSIGANAFYGASNIIIRAEAVKKPSGWAVDWNPDNRPVVWGYTGE